MSVGRELRDARVARGLSLDDVSAALKVRTRVLQAIETTRPDDLPPLVYVRGYLRAFAQEVGLDPADIAQRGAAEFAAEIEQRLHRSHDRMAAPDASAAHHTPKRPVAPFTALGRLMRSRAVMAAAATALAVFTFLIS